MELNVPAQYFPDENNLYSWTFYSTGGLNRMRSFGGYKLIGEATLGGVVDTFRARRAAASRRISSTFA